MTENDLLKRLQLLKKRPDLAKELSPTELADLVLVVLSYVKSVQKAIDDGKVKGDKGDDAYTPIPDKDYPSIPAVKRELESLRTQVTKDVQKAINAIRQPEDGEDAVISDRDIERAANLAFSMIKLPDFSSLITQEPEAIRNSLELLKDDERLDQSAIKGLTEVITELKNRPTGNGGGGAGARAVKLLNDITNADTAASGTVLKKNSDGSYSFLPESGGGGAVSSVNGKIGAVVLDAADVGADPAGTVATKVPLTRTINGHALSSDITLVPNDILPDFSGSGIRALAANPDGTLSPQSALKFKTGTSEPTVTIQAHSASAGKSILDLKDSNGASVFTVNHFSGDVWGATIDQPDGGSNGPYFNISNDGVGKAAFGWYGGSMYFFTYGTDFIIGGGVVTPMKVQLGRSELERTQISGTVTLTNTTAASTPAADNVVYYSKASGTTPNREVGMYAKGQDGVEVTIFSTLT